MTIVKKDDQEFKKGEHYIYTPMHGWATQEAFKQGMKSAFDFLDEDEMTFHENQNIETPVETVHFIKKSTSSYFIVFNHNSNFLHRSFIYSFLIWKYREKYQLKIKNGTQRSWKFCGAA